MGRPRQQVTDDKFIVRFFERVDTSGPCWRWTGSNNGLGYGYLNINGRRVYAHRVAYERWVGPIPRGLTIDHLCRNPPCVNPAHLEPVTLVENVMRGTSPPAKHARVTHCPRGHAYDEKNTYITKPGTRCCRECQAAYGRRWRAERRTVVP